MCLGLATPDLYQISLEEKQLEEKVNGSILHFLFDILLPVVEFQNENENFSMWKSRQIWSLNSQILIHISDLHFPFFRNYFAYLIGELQKFQNNDQMDDKEESVDEDRLFFYSRFC